MNINSKPYKITYISLAQVPQKASPIRSQMDPELQIVRKMGTQKNS